MTTAASFPVALIALSALAGDNTIHEVSMRLVVVLLMAAACGDDKCPEWLKPNGAESCLVPGGAGAGASGKTATVSAGRSASAAKDAGEPIVPSRAGAGSAGQAGREPSEAGRGGAGSAAAGDSDAGSVTAAAEPRCGDGSTDDGELCDGDCPKDCGDNNPCTVDTLAGEGCTRACEHKRLDDAACWDVGRYVVRGEVVIDPSTKLVWQRNLPSVYLGCTAVITEGGFAGRACSWFEADGYCKSLMSGDGSWRLPTLTELQSLLESGKTPAIDISAFPHAPAKPTWTSTSVPQPAGFYMQVDFGTGGALYQDGLKPLVVRCVRYSKQGDW